MSELVRDRKVVSVITCRGLWKRGYRIFEKKIAAGGGRIVDSLVLRDPATQLVNPITTVFHLLTGRTLDRGPLKRVFPPIGIGEDGLRRAREFGKRLSARLTAGDYYVMVDLWDDYGCVADYDLTINTVAACI